MCHQLIARSSASLIDFYQFYFTEHGKTSFSANAIARTVKHIWVEEGEMTVVLASQKTHVKAGQALTFNASIPHRFENRSGTLCKGTFFVTYER